MAASKRPGFMSHLRSAYRSGLEVAVAAALAAASIPHTYETVKLPFVEPAKSRTYKPDFALGNGIVVETKGLFDAADRAKHLLVKAAHPAIDIRLVFTNPNARIAKGSPTTYASWCQKNGFQYAKKVIPDEWLAEAPNTPSITALRDLGWSL